VLKRVGGVEVPAARSRFPPRILPPGGSDRAPGRRTGAPGRSSKARGAAGRPPARAGRRLSRAGRRAGQRRSGSGSRGARRARDARGGAPERQPAGSRPQPQTTATRSHCRGGRWDDAGSSCILRLQARRGAQLSRRMLCCGWSGLRILRGIK